MVLHSFYNPQNITLLRKETAHKGQSLQYMSTQNEATMPSRVSKEPRWVWTLTFDKQPKSQTVSSALKMCCSLFLVLLIISTYEAELPTLVCISEGQGLPSVLRYKKFIEFHPRVWKEPLIFKFFFYVRPKFNTFRQKLGWCVMLYLFLSIYIFIYLSLYSSLLISIFLVIFSPLSFSHCFTQFIIFLFLIQHLCTC